MAEVGDPLAQQPDPGDPPDDCRACRQIRIDSLVESEDSQKYPSTIVSCQPGPQFAPAFADGRAFDPKTSTLLVDELGQVHDALVISRNVFLAGYEKNDFTPKPFSFLPDFESEKPASSSAAQSRSNILVQKCASCQKRSNQLTLQQSQLPARPTARSPNLFPRTLPIRTRSRNNLVEVMMGSTDISKSISAMSLESDSNSDLLAPDTSVDTDPDSDVSLSPFTMAKRAGILDRSHRLPFYRRARDAHIAKDGYIQKKIRVRKRRRRSAEQQPLESTPTLDNQPNPLYAYSPDSDSDIF
jgi:hypothetical protein